MTDPLPPLNALRAFEAAARHASFTAAAVELHVTPAAISRHVRALEEALGVRLFQRLTRAVALTPAGAAALPLLTEGFAKLRAGVARLREACAEGVLRVSAAPSVASRWLVPRLGRFARLHPKIEVQLDASERLADFAADGVDVAIRYGPTPLGDLRAICLLPERTFPVWSPALVGAARPIRSPVDLLAYPLLGLAPRSTGALPPDWADWLAAVGLVGAPVVAGLRFQQSALAIEAALAGHGVALAIGALVADDLRAGRLLRLEGPTAEIERPAVCYRLVYPPAFANDARVRAFRDWALAEARQDEAATA